MKNSEDIYKKQLIHNNAEIAQIYQDYLNRTGKERGFQFFKGENK